MKIRAIDWDLTSPMTDGTKCICRAGWDMPTRWCGVRTPWKPELGIIIQGMGNFLGAGVYNCPKHRLAMSQGRVHTQWGLKHRSRAFYPTAKIAS